jgi:hypothetical protein
MKRFGAILAVMGVATAVARGGTTADFLTLPAGARSAALGRAGTALAKDASVLLMNPAGMAGLAGPVVAGTHGSYIDGSSVDQVNFVQPRGRWGAWGVGVQYFSAGSIHGVDENLIPTQELTPNDLALTAGYARRVWGAKAGGAVKYVRSTLLDTASTVSLDVGVETRPLWNKRMKFALVGHNLIGSLKYETESEDLPRRITAGAGYAVTANWSAALDVSFPTGEDAVYGLGTEYRLNVRDPWGVALRGGYSRQMKDVEEASGFTMGLGVRRGALTVDYAFLPFGDLGNTHWFTLGWKLGAGSTTASPPKKK